MTTLSFPLPTVGTTSFSTAAAQVNSALTAIETWANGSVDGVNVVASLTGRRLVAQAAALIPPSTTVGSYFIAADGTLVASGASSSKPVMWWFLDSTNFAVAGKSSTQLLLRYQLAVNNTAPGASVTVAGQLVAMTFAGAAGNVAPTAGSVAAATGNISNPSANSVNNTAESAAVTFGALGASAPIIVISGATTAANSAMSVLAQLFVLNT